MYILPLHDIESALKEVQRIANEGARAVQLPLYPSDIDLAPYWDDVYDPLWSAIEDLGIPISQHTGANEYLFELMDRDPTPAKGIFQSLPSMYMAEAMASWLLPGIFVRHPRLQVGFVEAGLGWLPYFLTRLDRMSDRHGWEQLGMGLPEKPSHYWNQNMFATFEEDEFGVENRHEIGVDTLLWATDYPHPDSHVAGVAAGDPHPLRRRARRRDAPDGRRQRGADLPLVVVPAQVVGGGVAGRDREVGALRVGDREQPDLHPLVERHAEQLGHLALAEQRERRPRRAEAA